MTVVGPDELRSICVQIRLKLKRSSSALIKKLTVSKAVVPILLSPHNYPEEFPHFVLAVIIAREMARMQSQSSRESENMEIDDEMTNNGKLIHDYEDEVSDDQMHSNQDFMTNEDLVDDFFDSLSISETATARINALAISETAAPEAPMTANDEMACEAASGSSSQRSTLSPTPLSFGCRHTSPLSSVPTTSGGLFTPRCRERSLSIPSSNQTCSSPDFCRGSKRKSPDNAFTLSSRPEKRICFDENLDEEMDID